MKYRDLITLFMVIVLILSIAYVIAVNSSLWFVLFIILGIFSYLTYKLWIEK